MIKCRLLSPPPLGAFQNKITHTHVSSGLAFPTMHHYLQLCRPAVCRLASPSASPGLGLWAYYSLSWAAPENDRRGRKIQTYRPSSDCHTRCIRQRLSWAHQRCVSAPEKKKSGTIREVTPPALGPAMAPTAEVGQIAEDGTIIPTPPWQSPHHWALRCVCICFPLSSQAHRLPSRIYLTGSA